MKKLPRKTNQLWFFEELTDEDFPEFPEPKDDNERFLNLWSEWKKTRSKKAWSDMWLLVLVLCRKAVRLEIRRKSLHFTSSEIEDFALDATSELMNRLQKYWGYSYRYIVTAASQAVRHPLYKNKDAEILEKKALDLLNSGAVSSWEEVELVLAENEKKKAEDDNGQLLLF